ncbi:MAG: DUF1552 domain-containing protein [Phycisphaerales bacterium]|nr:DUF1552 domain-containing protein [Phycisphaerales bacterium]
MGMSMNRRMLLRGMGTAITLPWLEALAPDAAAATMARTNRAAFLFIPNGVHKPDWAPQGSGMKAILPNMLEPLNPLRKHLSVISGLNQDNARALGDGPGDHARSSATFLTGVHPYKTGGANLSAGVSVDQIAAQAMQQNTKFGSLELGCDPGLTSGNCDSGYSCAYSANISWRSPETPMAKEISPRRVFDRLFARGPRGESDAARAERLHTRRSVLDFVKRDANLLRRTVGVADRARLDNYLDGVRDLERRVDRAARTPDRTPPIADMALPEGVPADYREHLRLMHEMIILAWQADLTRVVSFMWANEGSGRRFPHLGIHEGHHHLSHHGGDASMIQQIRDINRFQMEELAWFLKRLGETPDGPGGTLLDNSMVLFGGAIGDGNRHNHDDLPIVLAGHGAGTLQPSMHVQAAKDTPLCNLFLSMLDRLGAGQPRFGDSTGRLTGI